MNKNISNYNKELREKDPSEIIKWALRISKKPLLTTNFRPYEAAIIHLCTKLKPKINILWCDTGYNTKAIYSYAEKIINSMNLNIKLYVPLQTSAHREVYMGKVPEIDDPKHKEFTEQVKLEPFNRAMEEIRPDLWITNLRKGQTKFRNNIDIVTSTKEGLLKVSPFYYWSDSDLEKYMKDHELENEFDYFDPTKVDEKRECGLHNGGNK
ncbi:phosphoadenosine phosphosulfate reductase family protein [Methylophilaceae bacterium]|jgi:phosphoadenosine phosphosulfate reductase|nr:phosphoadenosine phosphosulfate reductase family protein [Methylophilaceae bacterium]|tara:strand:+ start:4735 stop:5364 length:630 start_codon:yes stop_codon:yes gene_type:complete